MQRQGSFVRRWAVLNWTNSNIEKDVLLSCSGLVETGATGRRAASEELPRRLRNGMRWRDARGRGQVISSRVGQGGKGLEAAVTGVDVGRLSAGWSCNKSIMNCVEVGSYICKADAEKQHSRCEFT